MLATSRNRDAPPQANMGTHVRTVNNQKDARTKFNNDGHQQEQQQQTFNSGRVGPLYQ